MECYFAYRRDGGENQGGRAQLFALVPHAILVGDRDPGLTEDPELDYSDAVELQLLLEALAR
jgi:hypothetical protein